MDEVVTLVNEKDEVIGKKVRRDLTDDECWRAICIWVEDGKGNVLMQKRTADRKVEPNMWTCAVVGTVADGDTYEITAEREAEEEIGMKGVTLTPTTKVYSKTTFGWRWYQGYIAECDQPLQAFTIQDEEVAEIAWVDKQTVIEGIRSKDPRYSVVAQRYIELFNLI